MVDDESEDDSGGDGAATYDPGSPGPPPRAPPVRSTAPQSEYTTAQVAFGFVVLAVGLAVVVGLPLALG